MEQVQAGPSHQADVVVIGSGLGGLSAAALMAQSGARVAVLEQNYLPGGCTSSYWRKGFTFEAGATTLVGLDEGMPLHFLVEKLGLQLPARKLSRPMEVYLPDGTRVSRYPSLPDWIAEAERVFGKAGQAPFWTQCAGISDFVWATSLRHRHFPPQNLGDIWQTVRKARPADVGMLVYAFQTVEDLLRRHGLHKHATFRAFVDQQLIISAQNAAPEVNVLFGATALCYTLLGNYYLDGGLMSLVRPFCDYIEGHGGHIHLRTPVTALKREGKGYRIETRKQGTWWAPVVISGIPLNNLANLAETGLLPSSVQKRMLPPEKLASCFQMGIAFRPRAGRALPEALHHQVFLPEPWDETGSQSVFVSFSHPDDTSRSDEAGLLVASVSTHVHQPHQRAHLPKEELENRVLTLLAERDLIHPEEVVYRHSSAPGAWEKWTGRAWGFVGGYPQFKAIKPWQMQGARLDGQGLYLASDTGYPGQGIPGVSLAGIIAWEKWKADGWT